MDRPVHRGLNDVAAKLVQAQAQKKLPVVAFLHSQRSPPPEVEARSPMQARLRELGWDDGKTFRMEYAYLEGREDRLRGLAAALVDKRVDVIVTAGGESTRAAKRATDTIPIVAIGPNLVAMGFASSFARPGRPAGRPGRRNPLNSPINQAKIKSDTSSAKKGGS